MSLLDGEDDTELLSCCSTHRDDASAMLVRGDSSSDDGSPFGSHVCIDVNLDGAMGAPEHDPTLIHGFWPGVLMIEKIYYHFVPPETLWIALLLSINLITKRKGNLQYNT